MLKCPYICGDLVTVAIVPMCNILHKVKHPLSSSNIRVAHTISPQFSHNVKSILVETFYCTSVTPSNFTTNYTLLRFKKTIYN